MAVTRKGMKNFPMSSPLTGQSSNQLSVNLPSSTCYFHTLGTTAAYPTRMSKEWKCGKQGKISAKKRLNDFPWPCLEHSCSLRQCSSCPFISRGSKASLPRACLSYLLPLVLRSSRPQRTRRYLEQRLLMRLLWWCSSGRRLCLSILKNLK